MMTIARYRYKPTRKNRRPVHDRARPAQPVWYGLALLIFFALLAGCAGSPTPTARYTLPVSQLEAPRQYEGQAPEVVVLEPIRMASYLNSEGIVMQLSDIEVQQARNHLWAERLSRQLERSLQQRLDTALPNTRVLADVPASEERQALRVRVELDRFQGHFDGKAVVSGVWRVRNSNGRTVASEAFNVEETLETDGYPALVRSLAQAWAQVGARLAEDLAAPSGN